MESFSSSLNLALFFRMPLMESLIIAPTSLVLSNIFSIIEAGISKNDDDCGCGGINGGGDDGEGIDWSALYNIQYNYNIIKSIFTALLECTPNSVNLVLYEKYKPQWSMIYR